MHTKTNRAHVNDVKYVHTYIIFVHSEARLKSKKYRAVGEQHSRVNELDTCE